MTDIREIDGLWCDDITFCPERCGWKSCPRNKHNIRDRSVPHSFSIEIPQDCPKKQKGGDEMDREKIIKGLKNCSIQNDLGCQGCPYFESRKQYGHEWCTTELAQDALALLKEQETGHWIYLENCSNSGIYCSECNTKVFDNYPFKKKFSYFCPHCGTRMEGETERR